MQFHEKKILISGIRSVTKKLYSFVFTDPPEVSSAKRAVYAGPGDRDVLTCIVKAEPRANVSLFDWSHK